MSLTRLDSVGTVVELVAVALAWSTRSADRLLLALDLDACTSLAASGDIISSFATFLNRTVLALLPHCTTHPYLSIKGFEPLSTIHVFLCTGFT